MTPRAAAGAALLVIFALGSQALLLWQLPWRAIPGADDASQAERRLGPLRDQLPARGLVGYRDEFPGDSTLSAQKHYFLAEYVLCPLVVERGDRRPLVSDGDGGARVSPAEAP